MDSYQPVFSTGLSSASLCPQTAMSQVEKKVGLLRRSSSSKKPLKEKVVLMYDEIFAVRASACSL